MRSAHMAYQSMQQLPTTAGQPLVSAAKPSVFRLEVINVPQYLNGDEFRAQFLKLDGCVEAVVEKDDSRHYAAYFVDFNTQDLAEKCIATFTQWKGWGPKGLAFRRVGFVFPNLSCLPSADGGAQPATQSQTSPSASVKHGLVGSAYISGGQLASAGSVHQGHDQAAALPQHGLPGLTAQHGVRGPPGTVMYQRPDGSLYVPRHGDSLAQSLSPPAGVNSYSMQHALPPRAGGADVMHAMASFPHKTSSSAGGNTDSEAIQNVSSNTIPESSTLSGAVPNSPAIQYVRLADGSLKAMMPVPGSEMAPRVNMLDQHVQAPNVSQVMGTVQSSIMINSGFPQGQSQHVQYGDVAPLLMTGPSNVSSRMSGGPKPSGSTAEHTVGNTQVQYMNTPIASMSPGEVGVNLHIGGISALSVDNASLDELPANASQTLYVDDVPLDMQKRELCHIFRPFGGFKEVRIVTKTTKEGRPYSFAFAQFENAECAAAALSCLNGYQYDPDNPELGAMQLKYARQERGKGGLQRSGHDDVRMQNRPRLARGDIYDSNENSQFGRFRRHFPEQKRPRQQ
eukprot:jgi/Ulvmu1/5142/UM021_0159.1